MSPSGAHRRVFVVVTGVALAILATLMFAGSLNGAAAQSAGPSPTPGGAAPQTPGAANASEPVNATLLAGNAEQTGGWNLTYTVEFTVPTGGLEILYAWAVPGNFSTWAPPVLPAGLGIAASIGWEGMAAGNLSAGSYTINITYAGWSNLGSVAVYGFTGNPSLQFLTDSQTNPVAHGPVSASLVMPSGGGLYLGVESTGGTWPVQNTSLTTVDEQAPAIEGGVSGLIGRQASNVFSFTSVARGNGIVGVAVNANVTALGAPTASLLASFSMTPSGWNFSFPLDFFVPSGLSQVVYLWSLGGNYSNFTPPTLPAGMSVLASLGYAGVAAGNLSSGSYTSDLAYTGWVNTVSIAVYGISGGENLSYQVGSYGQTNPKLAMEQVNLTLPAGAAGYIGVETTGGTWPVVDPSIPTPDEYAWALRGGFTGDIGQQASNELSFSSQALTMGIVGIGIYSSGFLTEQPVTFDVVGLPSGAHWTLTAGGSTVTTHADRLTFDAFAGSLPYLISGPSGYAVTGSSPTGTLRVGGSAVTETVRFAVGHTETVRFRETGLASGHPWCVVLSGRQACGAAGTIAFPGMSPATYSYRIVPISLATASARLGRSALATSGMLPVSRGETVQVTFVQMTPVTFVESGLASGTSWGVAIRGHTYFSTGSTLIVMLPIGSYHFRVVDVPGYSHARSPGHFHANGSPLEIPVVFSA